MRTAVDRQRGAPVSVIVTSCTDSASGVSRSEAIRGMPTGVSGESERRLRDPTRLSAGARPARPEWPAVTSGRPNAFRRAESFAERDTGRGVHTRETATADVYFRLNDAKRTAIASVASLAFAPVPSKLFTMMTNAKRSPSRVVT